MSRRPNPRHLTCGCVKTFPAPQPHEYEWVWCMTHDAPAQVKLMRKKKAKYRVADGRPRRLKAMPRSNNQHTKGRALTA